MVEEIGEIESGQGLEIAMVFDENSTKVLSEMKEMANVNSHEHLIRDAIRLYDWYLQNKVKGIPIGAKIGNQFHGVTLHL